MPAPLPPFETLRLMPLDRLALTLRAAGRPDADDMLRRVEGWQRLRHKVPTWAAIDALDYPHRLALEQCSGEAAARYKAEVVRRLFPEGGGRMADLTGGLGVDFSFVAPLFREATYVERQEALCRVAAHNFPLLALPDCHIVCGDGVEFLHNTTERFDLLFLDPARRDAAGRKTVRIADCEPDVCALRDVLLEKARYVVVKLSPMLDIREAVRALGCVREVHVVSDGSECKDLLLVLSRTAGDTPYIYTREGARSFRFTLAEEEAAAAPMAERAGAFLFEPGPAVMKAGAFRTVALRYGLAKLHPNSHLYTADAPADAFPGRAFEVQDVFSFSKQDLRRLRERTQKANLTVRNFPATVDALRRKLKLRDGGDDYLFATTLADGTHALVLCRKKFSPGV